MSPPQLLFPDPRFPYTDQTRRCWQNYVDYFKCIEEMGPDYADCARFKTVYSMICPPCWIDEWEEAREEGVNPFFRDRNDLRFKF